MFGLLNRNFRRSPSHYDPAATLDDVAACFRLLLGRLPNKEEWHGHSRQAGEPLAVVVGAYLNSLEFSRRGLLQQDNMQGIGCAALPEFKIYYATEDFAVGRPVSTDNYERDVTAVFRRVLRPGMGVLDLGANIGYFTLLSAALVGPHGHVLAIEPNPRNVRLLEASRRANCFAHVQVAQTAAGEQTGLLILNCSHSNGTTSGLPADLNAMLGAETVGCVAADALVDQSRQIDLIKVDVEGAEYRALLGCRQIIARCRPTIITEFSPDLMPGISGISGPDYLGWLVSQGYSLSIIEPDGAATAARTPSEVMVAYSGRNTDHVDLLATVERESG